MIVVPNFCLELLSLRKVLTDLALFPLIPMQRCWGGLGYSWVKYHFIVFLEILLYKNLSWATWLKQHDCKNFLSMLRNRILVFFFNKSSWEVTFSLCLKWTWRTFSLWSILCLLCFQNIRLNGLVGFVLNDFLV